jgi:hypothetical protein
VILGRAKISPSAGAPVRIGSNTKVGSVNVRVRSIRIQAVAGAEALRHELVMLLKRIDVNDACDRFYSTVRKLQLIGQPRGRNAAICIGVREPQSRTPLLGLQCHSRGHRASYTHNSGLTPHHHTMLSEDLLCDHKGGIHRAIYSDNDVAGLPSA